MNLNYPTTTKTHLLRVIPERLPNETAPVQGRGDLINGVDIPFESF